MDNIIKIAYRKVDPKRVWDPTHPTKPTPDLRELTEDLLYHERLLLATLGFNLQVRPATNFLGYYLQVLPVDCMCSAAKQKGETFVTFATRLMNTSLGATLHLRYHPEVVACAVIAEAAKSLKVELASPTAFGPTTKKWFKETILEADQAWPQVDSAQPDTLKASIDECRTALRTHLTAEQRYHQQNGPSKGRRTDSSPRPRKPHPSSQGTKRSFSSGGGPGSGRPSLQRQKTA